MERIWLEAVAQAEAQGPNQFLVVDLVQGRFPCLALFLLVIPQMVQAALVQISELSAAQRSLFVVI